MAFIIKYKHNYDSYVKDFTIEINITKAMSEHKYIHYYRILKQIGAGQYGKVYNWDISDKRKLPRYVKDKMRKNRRIAWKVISIKEIAPNLK